MRPNLRRRYFTAAAITLVVVASAAGCSAETSESGGGTVTLSLQTWDPAQKEGVQNAVDGFEAANPDIKVVYENLPEDQYYTKLDAALGAGEGPDVMWQSSRAPVYVDGGALEPLDEYIASGNVSMDAYPEQLVNLYNIDGKQYGMPKDQDVWTMVYNSAVFEQLGVDDLPTADWTWDDMVRISEELKVKLGAPPLFYTYNFNNGVASIMHQLGGTVVEDEQGTVSSPEGIEAFEKLKDLQDRGLIPPVADSTDFNAVSSLLSGTIAMAKIPSYQLSLLSQSDIADGALHVVPQPEINGSRATDTNGLSYVMNANSAHKDEAWELIKYLTSDEGAKLHVEGGASPAANIADDVKSAYFEANSKLNGLDEAFEATFPDQYLRTTSEYPLVRSVNPEIESTVTGPYYAGSLTTEEAAQKSDQIITRAFQ
jgi:multiple sugar transport system substrate-binding protein